VKKAILILLTNPIDKDSRVKKEIKSLLSKNFDVTLISLNSKETFIEKHHIIRNSPIFFPIPGINFLILTFKFLNKILKLTWKNEFIHCNDAQTLHLGLFGKLIKPNIELIYDSHELASDQGKKRLSSIYFSLIEKFAFNFIDKTITVSPSIAEWYENKYEISKPLVVLNCPPKLGSTPKRNIFREKFGINQTSKIFLYQGGLYDGRGIPYILRAFKKLDKEKYSVIFMGYGPFENEIQIASKSYRNIFFHPAVNQKELMDYTSSADWGLVINENTCLNNYYCLPNKLFECIQAEIPIIASNLKELSKVVSTWNLGIVADQISENGLLDAIKKTDTIDPKDLFPNFKNAKNEYCWEMQEKVLLSAYTDLQ
jgi:glycosyltransferase involved in cell wall biosynthesis